MEWTGARYADKPTVEVVMPISSATSRIEPSRASATSNSRRRVSIHES